MPEPGTVTPPRGKQAEALGLPNGFKPWTPFPFAGMNQKDSKYAIEDNEFIWVENMLLLGKGYLRSTYDNSSTPIYTASGGLTIIAPPFFYNIGQQNYCAIFLSDGTALQLNMDTLAQTAISSQLNTFYLAGGSLPACVQWGTQYLVIANNNTSNDYWIWDGTLLYQTGTLGPVVTITGSGRNYSSAPTLTFFGGSGTSVTATTTLDNGNVVLVKLTNPGTGYGITDLPQVAFSGGGSDTSAILKANLATGGVTNIVVTAAGHGYGGGTTVNITGGGGAGATATAVISSGKIFDINVTAPGAGYTSAPTITITGGGGSGATAFAQVNAGGVASVSVTNGGTNYIYPPLLTLVGGDGTGATAIAELTPTAVSFIKVTDGGSGYTGVPTVNVVSNGNPGAGATATAVLHNGSVIAITLTAPGAGYITPPYIDINTPPVASNGTIARGEAVLVGTPIASVRMNNQGQNYTSAPAVVITPGANNSAYATVQLMPFGVSGDSIEAFQSRIWLAHPKPKSTSFPDQGGTLLVSTAGTAGAGALTDFSPGDGGVLFTDTLSTLRERYTGLKQSNGYLYAFGDSGVDVISNVQTSGDPAITTFNYQNTDPTTGTGFPATIQAFGRTILFSNINGTYGLYGGAVTRVSDKINNLFKDAIFPPTAGALTPSSAVAYIHNVRVQLMLLTIRDPFTQLPRNVMLGWDEKNWYVFTQTSTMTFISNSTVESQSIPYGCDGTNIFQLFSTPSALPKLLVTKQYGASMPYVAKEACFMVLHGEDFSSDNAGCRVSIVANSEVGNVALLTDADLTNPLIFSEKVEMQSYFQGLTLGSTSKDFALYNIMLGYTDLVSAYGSDANLNAPGAT